MVNLSGLMGDPTRETGSMVNSMEKEFTLPAKESRNTESGKKARGSGGLEEEMETNELANPLHRITRLFSIL